MLLTFEDGTEIEVDADPLLEQRIAHMLQAILRPSPPPRTSL
ncbi:MAG: hypothetical protein ABR529_01885 [Actinomycetota bacterium]